MFYIIQFFKFIYFKGARGYLYLFLSLALVLSALSYRPIHRFIYQRFQVEKPLSYFHALVTGDKGLDSIKYKLMSIPGVRKIKAKEASHIQREAKEWLGRLGLEELYREEVYQGLQVFLDPEFQARAFPLVQEYMARLLGQKNVTFSTLKQPEMMVLKTKNASIQFLHRWGYPLLLVTMSLLWLLSFLSIGPDFKRYCYLIEEYQRRKNASLKIMILGLMTLMGLLSGVFVCFERVPYEPAAGVAALMILFSYAFFFRKRWG